MGRAKMSGQISEEQGVCDEAKFVQLIMDHVQSIHFLSLQLVLSVLGLISLHAFL